MKYYYKVDGELRALIMPEVYYKNRDNKHSYIINMVKRVHGLKRVLIIVK